MRLCIAVEGINPKMSFPCELRIDDLSQRLDRHSFKHKYEVLSSRESLNDWELDVENGAEIADIFGTNNYPRLREIKQLFRDCNFYPELLQRDPTAWRLIFSAPGCLLFGYAILEIACSEATAKRIFRLLSK